MYAEEGILRWHPSLFDFFYFLFFKYVYISESQGVEIYFRIGLGFGCCPRELMKHV